MKSKRPFFAKYSYNFLSCSAPSSNQELSPGESRSQGSAFLDRINSFSVHRQQVSIVQVNSSAPPSMSFGDDQDIQFADSEDVRDASLPPNQGKIRL